MEPFSLGGVSVRGEGGREGGGGRAGGRVCVGREEGREEAWI